MPARKGKPFVPGDTMWIVAVGTPNEMSDIMPPVRTKGTAKDKVMRLLRDQEEWCTRYDHEALEVLQHHIVEADKMEEAELNGYSFELRMGRETGWTFKITCRKEVFRGARSTGA